MLENESTGIELDTLGRPVGTIDPPQYPVKQSKKFWINRSSVICFSLTIFIGGFSLGGSFQRNTDRQAHLQDAEERVVTITLLTTALSSYSEAIRQYTTPQEQAAIAKELHRGILKLPMLTSSRGPLEAGALGPDRKFAKAIADQIEFVHNYQVPEAPAK